jgi:bacteriorhodopsin
MVGVSVLSSGQFQAVYNVISFALASMIFATIFMLVAQGRVLPRYRQALITSATVTGIAAYHYWRIFDSFRHAYIQTTVGGDYSLVAGEGFNEAYRYVDWLLTVPLLLVETVAVLALARKVQSQLLVRLIPASALMIILGYPGEVTAEIAPKMVWGALSTIPFLYILYILFVELGKSMGRQPTGVGKELAKLRLLLLATWGVYPISYLFPVFGDWFNSDWFEGPGSFVFRQYGYSIADVLAKCVFGLMIYKIARMKSFADDRTFAKSEGH